MTHKFSTFLKLFLAATMLMSSAVFAQNSRELDCTNPNSATFGTRECASFIPATGVGGGAAVGGGVGSGLSTANIVVGVIAVGLIIAATGSNKGAGGGTTGTTQ